MKYMRTHLMHGGQCTYVPMNYWIFQRCIGSIWFNGACGVCVTITRVHTHKHFAQACDVCMYVRLEFSQTMCLCNLNRWNKFCCKFCIFEDGLYFWIDIYTTKIILMGLAIGFLNGKSFHFASTEALIPFTNAFFR